ncbi:malectin domain-containing carbohydrate-binding protein [Mucilaginibacter sp.]|uniref:malectin domain-containing carbohydrate-binding protein n=1 Tax=Mucilaginibacter sp. TaxID=1882438 RepID=UPI002629B3EC|nr:malectin domain-containing carbohydrate-binding protein [Mucilaginibacter sp.]MDB4919546.1 glycoside hydrolase [Mucilaginibacter sp.]
MEYLNSYNTANGDEKLVYRLNYQRVTMLFIGLMVCLIQADAVAQQSIRQEILLNSNWRTIADDHNQNAFTGFEKSNFSDKNWIPVDVPHNWDTYQGYRRLKHGNKHGYAWYRKTFTVTAESPGKRYFLWFEGVGSYATVWLNGKHVGYHTGGRTSFTLDVTDAIHAGKSNLLCVRADHPAFIKDLPWVCGGCSDEVGFSEGSQPMGIFRPVHLIVTNPVRIEPFGVHIWNDTTVTERSATLNLETEVKNYSAQPLKVSIINKLIDASGHIAAITQSQANLNAGATAVIKQLLPAIKNVHLWSLDNPYLYTIVSQVLVNGMLADQTSTTYGIRWINWPIGRNNGDNRFYVNGRPVFINGIAEYEHLMGNSHAFSNEEIKARVMQVRAAGFNAFRDAHQPHNLAYQKYWDKLGLLWWPQYSAHIWFDTPEFKANYKALLRDWIKERRNSPSVILWGLENESKLPEDFAKECSAIIRELDPTASSQRKITTCNGGKGTDWDVPQNWTGTYGGDPLTYAQDLQKQILVGEYGAWRSLDMHTEGPFIQNGLLSEDRMSQLLETKVRLAESVKDKVAGQFEWLLYSHENPGRVQSGEGLRELDRVGPVNYKGLFTPWGEPLDAFYMFRANYASKVKEPMAHIVSHTWPNRWLKPGKKDSINVYSNCDEVELFNDVNDASLGRKSNNGIGTHFQWNAAEIKYNVLYAIGYVNGKAVAKDYIVLNDLPQAPGIKRLTAGTVQILKPAAGYQYLYRVNCGGPDYKDKQGNLWQADVHENSKTSWGSVSWTDDYPGIPAFFASQQRTFDPVQSTDDGVLFQSFRFGMNKLKYQFPVKDGYYRIELYFTEPWYGTGGGMDCTGWRLFNVAVNNKTVIKNLDIWKETGYNQALKKTVNVYVSGGQLQLSFPHTAAGEAIISAIAISTLKPKLAKAPPSTGIIKNLKVTGIRANKWSIQNWMDIGDLAYGDADIKISQLPSVLYRAEWIKAPKQVDPKSIASFSTDVVSDVYIAVNTKPAERPDWLKDYTITGLTIQTDETGGENLSLYKKRFAANAPVSLLASEKYIVAVLPVTSLEPATDLKPTVSYKAANALTQGNGVTQDTLGGKKVYRFTKTAGGSVIFNITLGVADKYELRIKYYNTGTKTFTAKVQLQAADGILMNEETVSYKPVKKGKSGTAVTSSGTSINAGNYKVIITAIDAEGLMISGLEMQ